ncbi:MAG TPA: DNA primase [Burkholderiales bacterium]|nr:DNA primase [Burkholderiales bacterium]
MIPQTFIQELLHRVDIVDVVERHVRLKRAGSNYVACCPFHAEKTPSFTVSQTKQFYHCFGCGAHGTAVGFLMEYSGLGFVEAVKDLAQSVGMTVPEVRSERSHERAAEGENLYTILLTAARFYRTCLKDAPRAIDYLKRRGLSGDIAKRFGIGYAPDGWQNLAGAFPDYDAKALASAGLVKQNEEGRRYDVFRDRVMFPIVDVRGNVIGFGGRVLEASDGAKYLNSPETPVFEKGRELYGLYQARRAIRDAGRVIVVEGYMDVVALAQNAIEYAVATLGTATTAQHVQKLLRQSDEVIFCFDGDSAGRRAAWKALETSLPELVDGKQVRFLFLPQGEDPDSYVRSRGKDVFERLLNTATPLSRYLMDELTGQVDLSSAEGRAALIHAAKPHLAQLQNNTFRLQLVRDVAEKARLTPEEVEAACGLTPAARKRAASPARAQRRGGPELWRNLLRIFLEAPELVHRVSEEQKRELQGDPEFAPVVALISAIEKTDVHSTAALLEATRNSEYAELYTQVRTDLLSGGNEADKLEADLKGAFLQLESRALDAAYRDLLSRPSLSESERQERDRLWQRLTELKGAGGVGQPSPM